MTGNHTKWNPAFNLKIIIMSQCLTVMSHFSQNNELFSQEVVSLTYIPDGQQPHTLARIESQSEGLRRLSYTCSSITHVYT